MIISLSKILTKDYFKNNHDYSMWRYLPLMSVIDSKLVDTLKIGWTPLYHSNRLHEIIGLGWYESDAEEHIFWDEKTETFIRTPIYP